MDILNHKDVGVTCWDNEARNYGTNTKQFTINAQIIEFCFHSVEKPPKFSQNESIQTYST